MLIQPEPKYQPKTNPLDEVTFIGVHSNLALALSKSKDASLQRAGVLWCCFRSDDSWIYTKTQVIEAAIRMGKSKLAVSRWLKRGEGIFWHKGFNKKLNQQCYYWIGKDAVFRYFKLSTPGRVLTIHINDLLAKKLTILRANLKDFVITKEVKWASRETLAKLTGVSKRTQQLYDKESGIYRQYTTVDRPWTCPDGRHYEVKQMPSIYYQRFTPFFDKTKHKRHNLYTSDYNAMNDDTREAKLDLFAGRLAFDDKEAAEAKAVWFIEMGIHKDVFYKDSITTKGNILWKVIEPPIDDLLLLTAECIGL